MELKLTFNLLPILGVLISVLAWYIPGFKTWYDKLPPQTKQLFMVGVLAIIDLAVVGLSLANFLHIYTGATWQAWVWYPLVDFVIALLANSGTYKATNYMLGGK